MAHSRIEAEENVKAPHGKMNTSLKSLSKVNLNNNPKLVPIALLKTLHLIVKILFTKEIPNVPLAVRIIQFLE